jgi:hypothetical protein
MKRYLLTSGAALILSTGGVLAAGPAPTTAVAPAAPQAAVSPYYGYYNSGYVFPDDGSPSGNQPMARAVQEPPEGIFSRIYLYPPAEGGDSGNGAG